MLKNIYIILVIKLFFTASCLFGMELQDPEAQLVKIQTNDDQEFEIALKVANKSNTLKHLIEDVDDEDQALIPLPQVSGPLFTNLLSAMEQLACLPEVDDKEKQDQQLKNILLSLKPNNEQLDNGELINFVAGANYLEIIQLIGPAMHELSQRSLSLEDWRSLGLLGDMIKDLWKMRPDAKEYFHVLPHENIDDLLQTADGKFFIAWSGESGLIKIWSMEGGGDRLISLPHIGVSGLIESIDKGLLVSWSKEQGTIKIYNKNDLLKRPVILNHKNVGQVAVTSNGKYLISFAVVGLQGAKNVKIWAIDDFTANPITLEGVKNCFESKQKEYLIVWFSDHKVKLCDINDLSKAPIILDHFAVRAVIESSDNQHLLSYSGMEIKIWDMDDFTAEPNALNFMTGVRSGFMESSDGKYIIAWAGDQDQGIIDVWDKNNLHQDPLILNHPGVSKVVEIADGKFVSSGMNESRIWDVMQPEADPIIFDKLGIKDVLETGDAKYLILISEEDGVIKLLNVDNFIDEPIILDHSNVEGILVTFDKKNLITFSSTQGSIKIWNIYDLKSEPIILNHSGVKGVIENSDNGYLISWSALCGTVKIWGIAPAENQILLLLASYFVNKGNQRFHLTHDEQKTLKSAFNESSLTIQKLLKKQAPELIADLEEEFIVLD